MKRVLIIGVGAGDPEHLTLQAVKAIQRADVFFLLDKGEEKAELLRSRQDMIEEYARGPHRVVQVRDPDRDRTSPAYATAVRDWRTRRADLYEQLILHELGEDQTGAFLVWGDPCLYDSTTAIIEDVSSRGGTRFDYDVIPGISSVSALAARHRTTLTQVGQPGRITTGRRLAEAASEADGDVVVMLDAHCAFAGLPDASDLDIFWGAYLGTPDEILVSGRVNDVAEHIQELRTRARERKGWIMDTYLLRRRS